MNAYSENVQLLNDDCLIALKTLADNSVDCCITSPPYWGLRDYGTAKWNGGDDKCDHIEQKYFAKTPKIAPHGGYIAQVEMGYKDICAKCGAKRIDSQLGLEKNPEEYVNNMVKVFGEVKRALKKEGTLWLNLGDSYAGNREKSGPAGPHATCGNTKAECCVKFNKVTDGLKPKDLIGIPWRVAFALQKDGWYLRQDIIWHKPNPMPESVTDRCTKAHEYIFLMSKQAKYYFDNEAIREEANYDGRKDEVFKGGVKYKGHQEQTMLSRGHERWKKDENGTRVRNKRSVWTITTKPFKDAHFATFPEDLILPCVLAGCPKGGTILDPFAGAGTTGVVAKKNNRKFIGVELNEKYIEMAKNRIERTQLNLF